DNDGWLDLFLSIETQDKKYPHPCKLFHNNQDGTFTETSKEAGVNIVGFIKGPVFGDYDNDGWQDLYIANFNGPHYLFKNNGKNKEGKVTFTNVAQKAGVEGPMNSLATFFFDYDN